MFAPLAPNPTTAFADCKSSSSTISGIKPAKAGHHKAFNDPLMNAITARLKTVAVPFISMMPFAITKALNKMSETPTTSARGNLSATTPPNNMSKTIGPICAAMTILNEEAVASSKLNTPNAKAIGPKPFPRFEIILAVSKVRKAGTSQSRFRSASMLISLLDRHWHH